MGIVSRDGRKVFRILYVQINKPKTQRPLSDLLTLFLQQFYQFYCLFFLSLRDQPWFELLASPSPRLSGVSPTADQQRQKCCLFTVSPFYLFLVLFSFRGSFQEDCLLHALQIWFDLFELLLKKLKRRVESSS